MTPMQAAAKNVCPTRSTSPPHDPGLPASPGISTLPPHLLPSPPLTPASAAAAAAAQQPRRSAMRGPIRQVAGSRCEEEEGMRRGFQLIGKRRTAAGLAEEARRA